MFPESVHAPPATRKKEDYHYMYAKRSVGVGRPTPPLNELCKMQGKKYLRK